MHKQLIVNADDFGLSEETNKGIIKAYTNGIVTSASLIMNMAGFEHAVALAKSHPKLDVGLHINLTWGRPLCGSAVASLIGRNGRFLGQREFTLKALAGMLRTCDIEREIRAQISAFDATGFGLYHVDSHQHVCAIPKIARIVDACLASRGMVYVRTPAEVGSVNTMALVLRGLVWLGNLRQKPANITTTDWFIGFSATGRLTASKLAHIIKHLRNGVTEMMVHPGCYDEALIGLSRLVKERETELKLLTDDTLPAMLNACDVRLVSFRELVLAREGV